MISITGLVLSNDDRLVGYIANENGKESILTEDVIIQMSNEQKIINVEEIRKEIIDGKEYIFINVDEQVTENVLYEIDAVNKIYSKKKPYKNQVNVIEHTNIEESLEKKVYRLSADLKDDKYQTFYFKNFEEDSKKYFDSSLKLIDLQDIWGNVYVYPSNKGQKSDCTHIWISGGYIVLNKKAADVLYPLLKGNAELLPIISDECKYYLINVTKYIDAVDYDRAIVKTLLGHRVSFDKIAIKPDIVGDYHIFKVYIDDIRYSTNIFVSDQFRALALEKGLTGFDFKEVD